MSPLGLRRQSRVLYTTLAPTWPLSVDFEKSQIIVQYGDNDRREIWEFVFDESGLKLGRKTLRQPVLPLPSDSVFGDNWILNAEGERIFWVPYEVALPNSNWNERACWVDQALILGGREGRMMAVDFNGSLSIYQCYNVPNSR